MLYFPRPYPDEIVGSLIWRASRHLGLPYKRVIQKISGGHQSYCSVLLPSYIPQISELTGVHPEKLLWQHTMFPYIVAFMSSDEIARLQKKILSGVQDRNRLSSLTKSVSQGTRFRRLCVECARLDAEDHGETYWHRSHIPPGSHLCIEHEQLLFETRIPLTGTGSNVLIMPSEAIGHPYPTILTRDVLGQIARNNESALGGDRGFASWYRSQAMLKGYELSNHLVASSVLTQNLREFYGDALLSETGCAMVKAPTRQWPAMMIRESDRGPFSTIKHVLLATFLNSEDCMPKVKAFWTNRSTTDHSLNDLACRAALILVVREVAREGRRVSVCNLVTRAGYWSRFRHRPHHYPETCAFLVEFRRSNLCSRQLGGRPKSKRARLARDNAWIRYLDGVDDK
jgi:hypothetical protein